MPFSLCNTPATFQTLMETVLAGMAQQKYIIYVDEILVIGKLFKDYLDNLVLRLHAWVCLRPPQWSLCREPMYSHDTWSAFQGILVVSY